MGCVGQAVGSTGRLTLRLIDDRGTGAVAVVQCGMDDAPIPRLTAADLINLARRDPAQADCATCHTLVCPGWESLPVYFDGDKLRRVGTLRDAAVTDPTVEEFHPGSTHTWSPEAPIAPAFFPYNRCDVYVCVTCSRPFLRYTEYGGYYIDERIREVHADRVVDAALTP